MLAALASRLEASWWRERDPLSLALAPVGWLYGAAWRAYAGAFERGWLRSSPTEVPVLVIGNMIVGGAGKTPTVLATERLLRERGYTPGIVSRGWGRHTDAVQEVEAGSPARLVGDEPLLLKLRGRAPVFVGRDRAAAVSALLRKYREVDLVICDDGAQHLALARELTVLVFDERGAGNGRLLPAGPLRQPMAARTPPAGCVVLYNAPQPSTRWRGAVARRRLAGVVELGAWWRGDAPSAEALDALRGPRLIAAAGIALPERFFAMLEDAGLTIDRCPLPDHHDYETMPWSGIDAAAIVTEKDAVKLTLDLVGPTRVWVAALDFEPEAGYVDALCRRLPPPRTTR